MSSSPVSHISIMACIFLSMVSLLYSEIAGGLLIISALQAVIALPNSLCVGKKSFVLITNSVALFATSKSTSLYSEYQSLNVASLSIRVFGNAVCNNANICTTSFFSTFRYLHLFQHFHKRIFYRLASAIRVIVL